MDDLEDMIYQFLVPKEGRIVSAVCVGNEPFPIEDIGNFNNPVYRMVFGYWVIEAIKSGWVDKEFKAKTTFQRNHLSYKVEDTGKWYLAISTDMDRTLH